MKKAILYFTFFLIYISTITAQNHTVSGIIRDSLSRESLISVAIVERSKNIFTFCNEYGFYSISLPKGKNTLDIILLGYREKTININSQNDTVLNIDLVQIDKSLQQIIVKADIPQMNCYNLPMAKINKMPVIGGETDVLKTLQLTPGVTSGNEGSASLNVRGGSPDQNLFLLDGVPVYNVNHVFGFFSVFNTDALKSVKLIKGGMPAEYHGHVSSVVDLYMKEGDLEKIRGKFTIGLISSKFILEGPVIKNKSSFIVTARRTYIDVLFRPISKAIADNTITGYYFYDVNAKWNYKLSERSHLYLSFYSGKDKGFVKNDKKDNHDPDILKINTKQEMAWGNNTGSLRWMKIFGDKLSMNNTLYYTKYKYNLANEYFDQEKIDDDIVTKQYDLYNGSGIEDLGYKLNVDYFMSKNNKIKFGVTASQKKFFPSFTSEQFFDNSSLKDTIVKDKQISSATATAYEYSLYAQDNLSIGKFNTIFGVNANTFYVNGKLYYFIEPRVNFIYNIAKNINIQASYSQVHQYLHLLTNASLGMPTDLWVPSTENLKPISAKIYDAGCKLKLLKNISFGLSFYYKTLVNLIKYKQGTDFMDVKTDWQDKVTIGNGRAYGIEFFAQKNKGKIKGQISYTYSRSFRSYKYINNGKEFPYIYDRPHNLNIQAEYQLNKKILFVANWILMSGQNKTYGYEQFVIENIGEFRESLLYSYISGYNNIRLPIYHRLDIAFNYTNKRKKTTRIWYLGIYNIYNRLNPFYMERSSQQNALTGISYAPITPFVSYSVIF